MRNKFFLLLLYFSPLLWRGAVILAQTNLVSNPSFEDTVSCPNNFGEINFALDWDSYSGSPEYYNGCSPTSSQVSVPYNVGGYQKAASGNAYAGLGAYGTQTWGPNIREFVGGKLISPLIIGTKYYASFKVSLGINSAYNLNCASNNMGLLLSKVTYGSCNGCLPVPKNPQIFISTIITDSSNWTRVSGSFITDSAYTYVIIGNFFTNNLTDTLIMDGNTICKAAYYYLDDVCVSTDSLTCNGSVGIENYFTLKQDINIYPNPAQNKVFYEITLKNNESGFVQLFDMLGNQINAQQLNAGFNKAVFDLSNVNDGMYIYRLIINAEIKANKKLIITK